MNSTIHTWRTGSVWWAETLTPGPEFGENRVVLVRTFGQLRIHQQTSINIVRRTPGGGLVWFPSRDWSIVASEIKGGGGSKEGVIQQHKTVVENLPKYIEQAVAYYKGKAS